MRSESPLSGPTKYDSAADIAYNFEELHWQESQQMKNTLSSFFCILFSTQNCRYLWEVEVEVNEIKNTNYRH